MSNEKITVVINTFNSEEKIHQCLNSIKSNIKIIVIENSNNLNFKNKIEKKYNNVNCYLTGQNLGYAKGNNLGLSKVESEFALILNPDAYLDKNAIDNFLNSAENFKDFSIIGPAKQNEYLDLDLHKDKQDIFEVNSLKGFAMFLNMSQFKEIGFFDENFFIYLEEIDFEMELSRNWHWMWSTFYFNKKHFSFTQALIKVSRKLFSSAIKSIFYTLLLNNIKRKVYYCRFSGLLNSIIGKDSWYRPKL